MEYAIFFWGGKQYHAQVGQTIEGEVLPGQEGEKYLFDQVLFYRSQEEVNIGDPYLHEINIATVIVKQGRGEKIRVARYKAKSRYRKVKGHRQPKTWVKIDQILVKKVKEG